MQQENQRTWNFVMISVIAILLVSQIFSLYLAYKTSQENLKKISDLGNKTAEDLSMLNKDFQSKVNTLTDSINTLSSSQDVLKNQISEVKAQASADFSGIIEQAISGVVTIKTDVAQGTGFLITNNGYIVTNAHVLSGAHYANIYTSENSKHSSDLIGYDIDMDVALLKISGSFSRLDLGNSNDVKVGEKVIAIGNPLGLSFTATEGIISARDRTGTNNLPYYFQTDVSLNPGNSGGPLIDTSGNVIGINNFKISGAENIGFALESNYIRQTINQIAMAELNMTLV